MSDLNSQPVSSRVSDASARNWAERVSPPALLPYVQLARLDRPAGWQLLLIPCWLSSDLASDALGVFPNLWHFTLFLVGSIVMRGAGCTYNDIVDRKLDIGVERTRNRPLPSGRVSVRNAKVFLVLQALTGLGVVLCFNYFTIVLGVLSLAIVAIYPFMKRITSWPQLVLGLAFAWGALMGWSAQFSSLALAPVALYVGCIVWTIGYDTIYALQDSRDDAIMGIRSTARLFREQVRPAVSGFYALAMMAIALALYLASVGPTAWIGALAMVGHLVWQISQINPDDGPSALNLFKSNRIAGLMLFIGLTVDAILRAG